MEEDTMTTVSRTANRKISIMFLGLSIGFGALIVAPGDGLARAKNDTIYNVCACACFDPATGFGEILADIHNTAGVPCGAYNNRACSLDGGTRTGTTKYCGGYKPGGTKATMLAPSTGLNAPIQRRGVEGDQPGQSASEQDSLSGGEIQERAIPRQRLGVAEMNCYCDGGNGTCSVTSTDGKTSTCSKGANDTCTGTCRYPKGTISGFTGGLMRQ
jgi:hypothetical protein